jgi:hypothetical protein
MRTHTHTHAHIRTHTLPQSELYALTSPGGPHYPPRSVQVAALSTLDHLFPANQTTRNVMRWIFRALHPTDWLGGALLMPITWATWAWGKVGVKEYGGASLMSCAYVTTLIKRLSI